MKFYVQTMTKKDYGNYLCGSNEYTIRELCIEAESKEEAKRKAENDGLVVNSNIFTEEEKLKKIDEEKREELETQRREQEKAQKKIANEAKKAKEMGLTVEEYREYNRRKRNYKACLSRMNAIQAEIEALKKELERNQQKANYWKEECEEIAGI